MTTRPSNELIHIFNHQNNVTKALQTLHGICSGMVCDGQINDAEVRYLSLWLKENAEIRHIWPASIVSQRVEDVLSDGTISPAEREYLLKTLKDLTGNDFVDSGSVIPVGPTLPADDSCAIHFPGQLFCFTGNFVYGKRATCERAVLRLGAMCVDSVSKKVDFLVIGSMLSADWFNTTYGRKIEHAAKLRTAGHPVRIVTENRWVSALTPSN